MSLVVRIALLRPLARRRPLRRGPRLTEALVTRSHHLSVLPGARLRPGRRLPAVVPPPAGPVAALVVCPASQPGTVEQAAT
ncbi:hypothetical protein [Micromonospora sagamiensis]|uniref:Uncharacterized protein n=1 Tax=Micromonospora sagamiensis TaxID=47875 RepID=A0A562WKV8_9ACTN|nr:hypothetical protein [Micromonospora sagamiensis]TWJ30818.1 hypothetical protein JD81_04367 [Micromonospora sagamiensis]